MTRPGHVRTSRLACAGMVLVACTACSATGDERERPGGALEDPLTGGRELFVSGTGSDGAGADGSRAKPFRTLQKAADLTLPGDTVSVLDGLYQNDSPNGALVNITRSGAVNAWIAYRAYPGAHPKLMFNGWNGILLNGGVSYIEVSGFDLQGNVPETAAEQAKSLAYCKSQKDALQPLCNGNGISVDGRKDATTKPHHLRFHDNEVHHCSGGGIGGVAMDYVTIENNSVHDTSFYTRYATSGISVGKPWMLDAATGYKIFVRKNKLWNNKTLVDWEKTQAPSDGNGIIIDSTSGGNEYGEYQGRVLVTNNVSSLNGGGGIHAYESAHVDIVNNTAFQNGQVVGYADIDAVHGHDVRIFNNIMDARPNGHPNGNVSPDVVYDYNLYSGAAPLAKGTHDVVASSGFVDETKNDFRLKPSSPAIDHGTPSLSVGGALVLAPVDDLAGAPRPQGAAFDLGAYEYSAGGGPSGGDAGIDASAGTDAGVGTTPGPNVDASVATPPNDPRGDAGQGGVAEDDAGGGTQGGSGPRADAGRSVAADASPLDPADATAGGGCAASPRSPGAPGASLVALVVLWALRRRRANASGISINVESKPSCHAQRL